jgi:hypothetical protein
MTINFDTNTNNYEVIYVIKTSGGSRRERRGHSPPPPLDRERERERRSSVPLLSISAFIHSPVKCNRSFTFSGPQTPHRLSSPLTQNPGSTPENCDEILFNKKIDTSFHQRSY